MLSELQINEVNEGEDDVSESIMQDNGDGGVRMQLTVSEEY